MNIYLLILLIDIGICLSAVSETSTPLETLLSREQDLTILSGSGTLMRSGPDTGSSFESEIEFTLSTDGKYHIREETDSSVVSYWLDESAFYERLNTETMIYNPKDGLSNSIYLRQMLFPGKTIISPLLEGAELKKTPRVESDAGASGHAQSFSVRDSEGGMCDVNLVFGAKNLLSRMAIVDSATSMAIYYEYSDYIDVGNGSQIPKYFRCTMRREASGEPTLLSELTLDGIEILNGTPAFSPDLKPSDNVTDYRKGLNWIKKEVAELFGY